MIEICKIPSSDFPINGGVNRHTAHTFVQRQRAASRLQTVFGERSEPLVDKLLASQASFGRNNLTSEASLWQCFFFFKLGEIPPQKCPKFLSGWGMGNFPPSLPWKNNEKCQRTLYVYSVNNSDIIPQNIFSCGEIAKKKHTQNIYII
jgi:hypothetical protein